MVRKNLSMLKQKARFVLFYWYELVDWITLDGNAYSCEWSMLVCDYKMTNDYVDISLTVKFKGYYYDFYNLHLDYSVFSYPTSFEGHIFNRVSQLAYELRKYNEIKLDDGTTVIQKLTRS